MKKLLMLAVFALIAVPTAVRAADEASTVTTTDSKIAEATGTKDGRPYFEASEKTTVQAKVLRVDKETRQVTLKGEQGDTLSVLAGDEVKNFAQIKVGDLVKITYTEKLTIHVEAAGTPEMTTETTTGAAKLGEKPSGSVTERTEYKATITAIDKENGTATLQGYDGEKFVVTPLHPENLDKVSVGELVVFTQTTAVAASVEKVVAAKKTKK